MKDFTMKDLEQLEAAEQAFIDARARARAFERNSCCMDERVSLHFAKAEEAAAYAALKEIRAKLGIG